jgi:transcriptional regulator with XRE-family HTH domain
MTTSPERQAPPIGERIRTIRRSKRLTQRAVAARAGLAEPFLSRVENGHAEPSLGTMGRIAAAMEVTIGDLLAAEPARFKSTCPVSQSGRCIAELIYQPGPRARVEGERYSPRQITLLRLANYLVQFGSPDTLTALETVMRGMLKLPGTGRDPRRLRALGGSAR